jgi:DNA-binding XRE family transcriptional regulator
MPLDIIINGQNVPYRGQTYHSAPAKFLQTEEKLLEDLLLIAFGKALRNLRKTAGITQEQLSFKTGMQRKHISVLENGHKEPSLSTLFILATALETPPDKFVALVLEKLKN